jgi:mono/diheme cytochrome c family protein
MNWLNSSTRQGRIHIGPALFAMVIYAASIVLIAAADTKATDSKPKQKTEKKASKQPRDGAELYRINCARCHAERYPTERTDAQWKTIMLHMRTRAQIPAEDAQAILKYLQDNN